MGGSFVRDDITFPSADTSCAGWLYRPEGAERPPVIVMAHGLGAVKEMRLDAFAERFAAAGLAALVFDYRHFGASGGEPRQLLDPKRQLADWAAAIAFARTLDGVDGDRVILWGTSFSGGHAIAAGAADGRVAAVISQCPFTDGLASALTLGPVSTAKVAAAAIIDLTAAAAGRGPVMVELSGPRGSAALMTAPDAHPGYQAIKPSSEIPNAVAARIGLGIGLYRPGPKAAELNCPALFCVCDQDSVAPPGPTLRHVAKAPRGEVKRYDTGHFDIYLGEWFEQVVADQLAFLARHHLLPATPSLRQ